MVPVLEFAFPHSLCQILTVPIPFSDPLGSCTPRPTPQSPLPAPAAPHDRKSPQSPPLGPPVRQGALPVAGAGGSSPALLAPCGAVSGSAPFVRDKMAARAGFQSGPASGGGAGAAPGAALGPGAPGGAVRMGPAPGQGLYRSPLPGAAYPVRRGGTGRGAGPGAAGADRVCSLRSAPGCCRAVAWRRRARPWVLPGTAGAQRCGPRWRRPGWTKLASGRRRSSFSRCSRRRCPTATTSKALGGTGRGRIPALTGTSCGIPRQWEHVGAAAASLGRGGIPWAVSGFRRNFFLEIARHWEGAAQGGDGVPILGGFQRMTGHGARRSGLVTRWGWAQIGVKGLESLFQPRGLLAILQHSGG